MYLIVKIIVNQKAKGIIVEPIIESKLANINAIIIGAGKAKPRFPLLLPTAPRPKNNAYKIDIIKSLKTGFSVNERFEMN